MALKLADTLFSTKPADDLLVVDVYQVEDSESKSKVVNLLDKGVKKLNLSFNTKGAAKNLSKFLKIKDGKVKFDPTLLKERLAGIKDGLKGTVRLMGEDAINNTLGKFGTSIGDLKQIKVNIGNTIKEFDPDNFKDVNGVMQLLSDLTGDPDFAKHWDLEAEFALFHGILEEVIALDIPGAIDEVRAALAKEASDPSVMENVLRNSLPAIVNSGDLDSILGAIQQMGVGAVLAQYPTILIDLVRRYLHPRDMERSFLPTQAAKLSNLLSTLDARWHLTTREGVDISDLTVYAECSRDATELLMTFPEHQTCMMIGVTYRQDHIVNVAKRYFRYAAI